MGKTMRFDHLNKLHTPISRDDNLTQNSMGVGTSEDFDSLVQPAPDPKFCVCGFLFQLAGDPHMTRNLVHSLLCAKMINIQ
jgi:hypothetical protein